MPDLEAILARKPLWWFGAAVAVCILLEARLELATETFLALLPCALLLAAGGRSRCGFLLVLVSLAGSRAAVIVRPAGAGTATAPFGSYLGRVDAVLPGSGRYVVRLSHVRVQGAWAVTRERVGVRAAGPAEPGDRVAFSARMTLPTRPGNPGEQDERHTWWRRGVARVAVVQDGRWQVTAPRSPHSARARLDGLRSRILDRLSRGLSAEARVLSAAMLLGDDPGAEPETSLRIRRAFREAGVIHLLVVSGSQVGLVALPLVWLGRRLYGLRLWLWPLVVPVTVLFALLSTADPPVLRATVFAGIGVTALALRRTLHLENALGAAGLALWTFEPLWILDVGAQLSFAAVWALTRIASVLLSPPPAGDGMSGSPWRPTPLLPSLFIASLSVQVVLAPILAWHFHSACWSSILANVVLVPLAMMLTQASLLHLGTGVIGPGCPQPVNLLAASLSGWTEQFTAPPFGSLGVGPPGFGVWCVCVLCLAGFLIRAMPQIGRAWILAGMAGVLMADGSRAAAPPARPIVRFLDVGQGDAALLSDVTGAHALVDTGPRLGVGRNARIVRVLRALRVRRLDYVFLSHRHGDHEGGMQAVLQEMEVRRVVLPEDGGSATYRLGASVIRPIPPGVRTGRSDNEQSLVLRWETPTGSVLLPGDIGVDTEGRLIAFRREFLRADVLKVAHHGSRGSTGEDWIRTAVRPICAVISCAGENPFGHPHREALARLREARVPVFRTDEQGMVQVMLERNGVSVRPWRRERGELR